jgi:hypothetical protein
VSTRDTIVRSRPYVLPRPAESEDAYRRFHHIDLAGMTPLELWAEHHEASTALAAVVRSGSDPVIVHGPGWALSASWWLRERVQRTQGGQP